MSQSIFTKLEASRKELLDLGLRNPLISYRRPKKKGIQIVSERSSDIYSILVNQQKAMTFSGKPDKESNTQGLVFSEPVEDILNPIYTDTKLEVSETDTLLQQKLLTIYYTYRTHLEEQGVNMLYITLGMIEWYESDSSEEMRVAPIVLVPVMLDRSNANDRFKVKFSGEDIGHNLSFQAKLKAEYNIQMPDLPTQDELDITSYFNSLASLIKSQKRWKINHNHIELGFFSFGKFMIYNDLDNTKWPENKKPIENSIFQSLFEAGFSDNLTLHNETTLIDSETNAEELFQVVDADSSQLLAMLAVNDGKNLVIQGPPGTGKSQTITNIISNAVGQGKKVLFVAEKMAALEVVKRRMDQIGLGDCCLELHSQKSNKKVLHEELKSTLELGKPSTEKLKSEIILLKKHQNELNEYCSAVNATVNISGHTPQQLFGNLLQLQEKIKDNILPKIEIPSIEDWNQEKHQHASSMATKIQERLKVIGVPAMLIFWGTRVRVLLPHEESGYLDSIDAASKAVSALMELVNRVAQEIGVLPSEDRKSSIYLATQTQVLSVKPDLFEMNIKEKGWLLHKDKLEQLIKDGKQLKQIREQYGDILLAEAWKEDVLEIRHALLEYGSKWYKGFISSFNRPIKRLKLLCKEKLPPDTATRLQYTEAILNSRRLEDQLKENDEFLKRLFGERWQFINSDWEVLCAAAMYLKNLHQQIEDGTCSRELIEYLQKHQSATIAKEYHELLLQSLASHGKRIDEILKKLEWDDLRSPDKLTDKPFQEQLIVLSEWHKRFREIQEAISWNNLNDLAIEEGMEFLTRASIKWREAVDFLSDALNKTWYEHLVEKAISERPALRKFERATHEETIQQFCRLDKLKLQYNRALVALRHWEGLPDITAESAGQVRILKGEFNKKARHMPIRKLIQEAGLAIQAIKPVMMMSPLSIANFLSPGSIEFDLVVFDEASQVRPVEALGAILRGKQITVVGDTKQLPPTSFFDTLNENLEDEESETADMPSILGMCDKQGASQRMLRWHYRSRHESLITLSNYEFYDNRLVIFPSPGSKGKMGLLYHYLPDTYYDRGQTKTNPKEAEKIVQAVMDHARHHSKLSLGVVAFSSAQRDAIQDVLERKRREHPELEYFFRSSEKEPFFVKNLENVQGDERDVIFISVGYGKTKEGYMGMNFGPLNNDGGEKRLNVLITRAKQRCEVFTNITSADIDTSRSSKRGILTLKSFLHYAQHGKLDIPDDGGRDFDSPFEEMVSAQLVKHGYTVRTQVGSSGFYIDLAIVDPNHPGRYILGIECDGAAYHSSRSARDRDRLRQQVLEDIGWRIHRIWGTEWFRNPEKELKRVIEAIEKAKLKLQIEDETEEEIIEDVEIEREEVNDGIDSNTYYQIASLSSGLTDQEIHLQSIGKLSHWVKEVVMTESPVHTDEVIKRIAENAGVSRVGARIKLHVEKAIVFATNNNEIVKKGDFLWSLNMKKPLIRNRSSLPTSSRKIKLIDPEEMELAIQQVVREAIAISPDSAVSYIARLFGFSRVTEEMKGEILDAIRNMVKNKLLQLENELLKLKG